MKTLGIRILFAALLLFGAVAVFSAQSAFAAEPEHIVNDAEIQAGIDQQLHSEASDRQAIRDLLARPEVQRIAGQAGLSLTRANEKIAALSGPELQRLASQARDVNSQALGGDRISMNTTTIIIILAIIIVVIVLL
jgi:cell division protein FtsL